jgi:hypothetical protein
MTCPNSPLTALQDIINNTSLAELEKRLKETPFDPPKVGKNIEHENHQTLEITMLICYIQLWKCKYVI